MAPKGSSVRCRRRAPGDPFAGGLGDLFDAFFNGMGGPGRRSGRRTGPIPGPDAEMVLRLSFKEAVFGVARQVEVETPGPLRHLRRFRGPAGHRRGPLPRVPGSGRAAPHAPVDPWPGDHRGALPALPGHRPVHRASVCRLRGRGTAQRTTDADRRHPRRRGRRLDPPPVRSRTGGVPGRAQRGPLRARVGDPRPRLRTLGRGPARLGSGPGGVGRVGRKRRLRDTGGHPGPGHRRRHAVRGGDPAEGDGRAQAPGTRSWRPLRARAGGHTRPTSTSTRSSCWHRWPKPAARIWVRHRRTRGSSRSCVRP